MKIPPQNGTERDIGGQVPTRPDPISYPYLTRDRLGVKRRRAFTPHVPVGDEGRDKSKTQAEKAKAPTKAARPKTLPKMSAAARRSLLVLGLKP